MKKVLLTFAFLLIGMIGYAQQYTQKYNELLQRTECYDAYGNLVWYAKYNDIYKRIEFYDSYGTMFKTESYNPVNDSYQQHDQYGGLQNERTY